MGSYIRRNAVFNEYSDRDMKIWNWAKEKTGDFKHQNFASFVRDSIEFRMNNEGNNFVEAEQDAQPQNKGGWSSLV